MVVLGALTGGVGGIVMGGACGDVSKLFNDSGLEKDGWTLLKCCWLVVE